MAQGDVEPFGRHACTCVARVRAGNSNQLAVGNS